MSSLNINTLNQQTDISSYNTVSPYSYSEWVQHNKTQFNVSIDLYNNYIQQWYIANSKNTSSIVLTIKQDYVNLLKELSYFFSNEEKNLFLKDINFNNDIEIIYAIPFFVQKLKEIALTISKKRSFIKNSRQKYNTIGSNAGLENIIYEYILKSHTKNNTTTQISISALGSTFPELSAVKDSFSIEIEELYDTGTYADIDLSIHSDYIYTIPHVSNNPLFNIFADFASKDTDTHLLTSYSEYTSATDANIYNEIKLNNKYLGSTIYGLTATLNSDAYPDHIATLNMLPGNNWFYWPDGEVFTNLNKTQNIYTNITLQDSNFTLSGTAGASYTTSDLLFVETRGNIEGAWLRGSSSVKRVDNMVMTAHPNEIRSFIYPTPGYGLTTDYKWSGRDANDGGLRLFNLLDPSIKTNIIKKYFTAGQNTDTVDSTYINNTNLVYSGAFAGVMSMLGDSVLVRPGGALNDAFQLSSIGIYNDPKLTKEAFLFKITSTELPITDTSTNIIWPLTVYSDTLTAVNRIAAKKDICNDMLLGAVDVSSTMIGAIAGTTIDAADIIYKTTGKGGVIIESAWLQGGNIKNLSLYNSYSIPVYDTPAINCVSPIEGAVQPGLAFRCLSDSKISFVWCDIDTPADEVFKYREHALDCEYKNIQNTYSTNSLDKSWKKCTCKAIHYSPIGHIGDVVTDYYGSADYLFADPQNLGANFTLTQWRDTRNFNYKTSPQFSYFKKTNTGPDYDVGWGPGRWKTGTGSQMILKTGRRYTYYRSGMRNLTTGNTIPAFNVYYPYKRILSGVSSTDSHDIVFVIDASGSQYFSIEKTKQLATSIIDSINVSDNSQVGAVIFNKSAAVACYLSKDKETILTAINQINIQDTLVNSNIADGLDIAYKMLINTFGGNGDSLASLCSNLELAITSPYDLSFTFNIPQNNSAKTIILFSDGDENIKTGASLNKATTIKNSSIKILSVDIGPNSSSTNLMERMASSIFDYFNYEAQLIYNDTYIGMQSVASSIVSNIYGNISTLPSWKRSIYIDGAFVSTNNMSDMIIRAGDFIQYHHQSQIQYNNFYTPSVSFIINIPLYGWNYSTNKSDSESPGAKPYWGKMFNYADSTTGFNRFARGFGGYIQFVDECIPISHPEVSDILLKNNDYIEYRNRGCNTLKWQESITHTNAATEKKWMKLKACSQIFNLKDIFTGTSLDKIFEQTNEPSDIIMQTYNAYTPAYYCYFANTSFSIYQPLYLLSNNKLKYSSLTTDVVITPDNPFYNLSNIFYASIATHPNLKNLVTKSTTGGYLLPTKLGVPYYLGRGYTNAINVDKISKMKGDLVFADPTRYTSNRGLTKKDQTSPYEPIYIDNTWIKESANAGNKTGIIVDAAMYQKFVPYQSSYESLKRNIYGLSRQDDQFEFWTGPNNNIWNDEETYPSDYKKQTLNLQKRATSLLTSKGDLKVWQTDIYGNNYGIFKNVIKLDIVHTNIPGELWMRDVYNKISPATVGLSSIYQRYIEYTAYYQDLIDNKIIDIKIFDNTLVLATAHGISFNKIKYDYTNKIITSYSHLINIIEFLPSQFYIEPWYDEHLGILYTNIIDPFGAGAIEYLFYKYNTKTEYLQTAIQELIQHSVYNIADVTMPVVLTYNPDIQIFSTSFVFNNNKLCVIETKNLTDNPYIISVTLGV